MPEEPLAALRELERADEEIGAALADLDQLANELDLLRGRIADLRSFEARLPSERERLASELERAETEAESANTALGEAEEAMRAAEPGAAREAELFQVRARDRVTSAERRLAEANSASVSLEGEAEEAEREAAAQHEKARALARQLRETPRLAGEAGNEPGSGLESVIAWSEVARAALFVARGQLAVERDAVIRQANELGAVALGEPLTSASAAVVARQVEQGLAHRDA